MYTFDPDRYGKLDHIILIGCGGTGSHIIAAIAQLIYTLDKSGYDTPQLTLIDPDTLDIHNAGRQRFTVAECEQRLPKANVLAQRYNFALGLNIKAIPEHFAAKRINHHPYQRHNNSTIIIGAVDNTAARATINNLEMDIVWIDAGNAAETGQIIVGNTNNPENLRLPENGKQKNVLRYLPNAGLIYPELVQPELKPTNPTPSASCAERIRYNAQNPIINQMIAAATSIYVYKLILKIPLTGHITHIDTKSLNVRTPLIDPHTWPLPNTRPTTQNA
ncbi:MAG: ThiF family adenylyltransferase [Chloroflexota bacterium]